MHTSGAGAWPHCISLHAAQNLSAKSASVLQARVADFGCSQHIRQGEKMGKKTGTPLYMAPELFMRYWGVQSDMWSAGMLLYQVGAGPCRDMESICWVL